MGYRKEKKRKAVPREAYRSCGMLGWRREDIVGKNEYLYVMSEDRQNLHFLRAFEAFSFLILWNIFDQTLPTNKKYRHGIFRIIESL